MTSFSTHAHYTPFCLIFPLRRASTFFTSSHNHISLLISSVLLNLIRSASYSSLLGEWAGKSAGGCLNHLSWRHNPQISLTCARNSDVTVTIYQPRQLRAEDMHEIPDYILDRKSTRL